MIGMASSAKNVAWFLLTWSMIKSANFVTGSLWDDLFQSDVWSDTDPELSPSTITNLRNELMNSGYMQNNTFDMTRLFSATRTSAKHTFDTERIGHVSNANLHLYQLMTTRHGISRSRALRILRRLLARNAPFCQARQQGCDPRSRFRTIDGSCNNLRNRLWGASFQPFDRLLPAAYQDGFSAPRGGFSGGNLPNPRLVSSTIHYDVISPDATITNLVPQLGQFIDHDMTLSPEGDRHCCTTDEGHQDCWPIPIPMSDPFYSRLSRPQRCMDFTRSTVHCFPGRSGIREQFNILTAFLDASQVYGSEPERAAQLRAFSRGRLAVHSNNPDMLPTVAEVEMRISNEIPFMGKYLAGDERVNEMPALTSMHILLVREHNRIADAIFALRPDWTDDRIYEESRRILIAEWQNVVFGEYLPVILGRRTMRRHGLTVEDDTYTIYNQALNPTIFHSFATAAFRFGHTLINGIVQLYKGLANVGSYAIKDQFFESEQVDRENGDGYNLILGGLMVQNAQSYDPHVTDALTNFLLRNRTEEFGGDLIARNLQRGREHGIPSYADYRRVCNLQQLTSWRSRPREIISRTWTLLRSLYRSPQDIDLFTGGLSEIPVNGAFTGATFNCLIALQFRRAKFGDRFFFTHGNQAVSFSPAQLRNIRRRTFGDIMCENSELEMTTVNVFRTPSANNPQVFCSDPARGRLNIGLLIDENQ